MDLYSFSGMDSAVGWIIGLGVCFVFGGLLYAGVWFLSGFIAITTLRLEKQEKE